LDQALNAALAVRKAIRQERRPETFYTRSEKPAKASGSRSKNEYSGQKGNKPKEVCENTFARSPEGAGYYKDCRDTQYRKEVKCFECEGRGQFASDCPTRIRMQKQNSPGRKHPSGRSSRPSWPRDESRGEERRVYSKHYRVRETKRR
jgi:hypothetical protein